MGFIKRQQNFFILMSASVLFCRYLLKPLKGAFEQFIFEQPIRHEVNIFMHENQLYPMGFPLTKGFPVGFDVDAGLSGVLL